MFVQKVLLALALIGSVAIRPTVEREHPKVDSTLTAWVPTFGEATGRSLHDFCGVMINRGSSQVIDIQWGTIDGNLATAYVRYLDKDGVERVEDQRSECDRVFNGLDEMHGFSVWAVDGSKTWIEDITLGVGRRGDLSILGMKGIRADGSRFESIHSPQAFIPGCLVQSNDTCIPGSPVCTVACPANPPCACLNGRCKKEVQLFCPQPADCPTGTVCDIDTPTTCACVHP